MAQETNNPPTTPKMSDEARDLVLRLKDLVTATRQRIAESRERLNSVDQTIKHDDPNRSG